MKYLFLFAHPDDESVACAGTIKRLSDEGHEVVVVSATDGGGGEVHPRAQAAFEKYGTVGALRRQELAAACELLGVQKHEILHFTDGEITNHMVWNDLKNACIEMIEKYLPEVVVTFDHTGWYFHLDHVGTSIATTLAVQEAEHKPEVFFLAHLRVNQSRWKYAFSGLPITHTVNVSELKELKLQAIDAHASQDLTSIINHVQDGLTHLETYQLVSATTKGEAWLSQQQVFEKKTNA